MQLKPPRISIKSALLSTRLIDIASNVLLLVPAKDKLADAVPYAAELGRRLKRAETKLGDGGPFTTDLPNRQATQLTICGIDPKASVFELLSLMRRAVARQHRPESGKIVIGCMGLATRDAQRAAEAAVAALLAADFDLPTFKSEHKKSKPLSDIVIHGLPDGTDFRRTVAEAAGNNLARYLTALPPNELTPALYRRRVATLARQHGWRMEFLDLKKLRARGAGAFIAVAQGSPAADAGIVHLRYTPKKRSRRNPVALVGKGICFDTGGTNLKPARYMHGMHEDMEGSAVALGTLLALTLLKVDFPVDCWMALAQNHIGPKAYKQNDVVRAANGKTIEVMHTDAEGRMVLADTLHFASRANPAVIVDYATLTGACVGALSTRVSGAFTNRDAWLTKLIKAGEESGERVWPFPLYKDFAGALKSKVADIKQCTLESDADHILATMFLKNFVNEKIGWVHIDLSAGNHKGGLAHVPSDTTGFGVRLTLELLLAQKLDT